MKIDYCILRLRNFLGIPFNPKTALTKLPLSEGQTVLDFGCRIGSFTLPAAQKVGPKGKVFALYKENTAPSEIRKAAQRKNLKNIKTIQSDAATHLPDNSVDPVLFIEVLPFVNDARTNPKGIASSTQTERASCHASLFSHQQRRNAKSYPGFQFISNVKKNNLRQGMPLIHAE